MVRESAAGVETTKQQSALLPSLLSPLRRGARLSIRIDGCTYGHSLEGEEGVVECPLVIGGQVRGLVSLLYPRGEVSADGREVRAMADWLGAILQNHGDPARMLIRDGLLINKMSTLEDLMAGLSHEINNPLNSAMLGAENLVEAWKTLEPVLESYATSHGGLHVQHLSFPVFQELMRDVLANVFESLHRIRKLADEVSEYILGSPLDGIEPLDVNEVVKSSLTLVAGLVKRSRCAVHVQYAEALPEVRLHYQLLEQVLVNLVLEACRTCAPCQILVQTEQEEDKDEDVISICGENTGIVDRELTGSIGFSRSARDLENAAAPNRRLLSDVVAGWGSSLEVQSIPGKRLMAKIVLPAARPEVHNFPSDPGAAD